MNEVNVKEVKREENLSISKNEKKEYDEDSRKKVVDLVKFEFEYIAVLAIVFALRPINLDLINDVGIVFLVTIASISISSLAFTTMSVVEYFVSGISSDRTIEFAYRFIMGQILVVFIAVFGYFTAIDELKVVSYIILAITYVVLLLYTYVLWKNTILKRSSEKNRNSEKNTKEK